MILSAIKTLPYNGVTSILRANGVKHTVALGNNECVLRQVFINEAAVKPYWEVSFYPIITSSTTMAINNAGTVRYKSRRRISKQAEYKKMHRTWGENPGAYNRRVRAERKVEGSG